MQDLCDETHHGSAPWTNVRGNKVDKYVLGKTLGAGAFGKVKSCIDTSTGTTYAVKVVNKDSILQVGMDEQFRREISALRNLRHDHIVRLVDVLESEEHYFIVQELVKQGDLIGRMANSKEGYLSETIAQRYFQQLCSAVAYLHAQGLCHRDLKLDNVMLDENDAIKLLDFGFVNSMIETKYLTTICGSIDYCAPEIFAGGGYDGLKADIWSLGCLLYVLLVGRLPFRGKTTQATLQKLSKGEVHIPARISPSVSELITHMLNVNPGERWTIQNVVQHPWVQETWNINVLCTIQLQKKSTGANASRIRHVAVENTSLNVMELLAELSHGEVNRLVMNTFQGTTTQYALCRGRPDDVGARFFQALKKAQGNPEKTKVDCTEISGFVSVSTGVIVYHLEFHATRGTEPHTFVAIHRLRGSGVEFLDFCELVKVQLEDILLDEDRQRRRLEDAQSQTEPVVGTFELLAFLNSMDLFNLCDAELVKPMSQKDAFLLLPIRSNMHTLRDVQQRLIRKLNGERIRAVAFPFGDHRIIGHAAIQPLVTFMILLVHIEGISNQVLMRIHLSQGLYTNFKTFVRKLAQVLVPNSGNDASASSRSKPNKARARSVITSDAHYTSHPLSVVINSSEHPTERLCTGAASMYSPRDSSNHSVTNTCVAGALSIYSHLDEPPPLQYKSVSPRHPFSSSTGKLSALNELHSPTNLLRTMSPCTSENMEESISELAKRASVLRTASAPPSSGLGIISPSSTPLQKMLNDQQSVTGTYIPNSILRGLEVEGECNTLGKLKDAGNTDPIHELSKW